MTYPGYTLLAIDWAITTAPFGGTTLASGTATYLSITNTYFGLSYNLPGSDNYNILAVNDASFELTPTTLAAGTYFFQLGNASEQNGQSAGYVAFWDVNNGPSSATTNYGKLSGSNSFQLTGNVDAAVPESSSFALLALGAFALVARRHRPLHSPSH